MLKLKNMHRKKQILWLTKHEHVNVFHDNNDLYYVYFMANGDVILLVSIKCNSCMSIIDPTQSYEQKVGITYGIR